ncbi:MAG: hypothetical protein Q8M99_02500 [Methylotenera sp.]|nr:hypothetical protein [Methylotenera sp.]
MSRNVQIGLDQELKCLILVGRFGWLRLQEIALFLWFDKDRAHSYQYAQNLVKKLIDKDLVFIQKLPCHAGTAVVLKEKGAKIVRENGFPKVKRAILKIHSIMPMDGDDYDLETWIPPACWKHDLYSHGLCVLFANDENIHSRGYNPKFWTEVELRRLGGSSNRKLFNFLDEVRYPDLIVEGEIETLGFEIEKSRKNGELNTNNMILNLIQTNKINGVAMHSFGGVQPDKIAFAINPDECEITKSGKRKKINHELNVISAALAKMSQLGVNKIELIIFRMHIKNYGVVDYDVVRNVYTVPNV